MRRRVIINDASILIDIHILRLLEQFASLPHELWIPDSIWEDELLSLSLTVKDEFSGRFLLGELTGEQVLEVQKVTSLNPKL